MTMPQITVDASGISAPAFTDYQNWLVATYVSIYGADAYQGNDSQDGQFIAAMAQAMADNAAAAVAVYNAFSPVTAQGNGLSSGVKINGLSRLVPTNSTAPGTVTGVSGTVITNGLVTDTNGNTWALPSPTTIGIGGTIGVTVTCQTQGAIAASSGTINSIKTPVLGWQSFASTAAATPGAPVETDAALRVRQAVSTALPSSTIFAGITAAIRNLPGVTRVGPYENKGTTTDGNGLPAGSCCWVVEGGVVSAIQAAIYSKLTPGTITFGTTSTTILDSDGSTRAINFDIATPATIGVDISVKELSGWASGTSAVIQAALSAYIASLPIGVTVRYLQMALPAALSGTSLAGSFAITAITLNKNGGSFTAADVTLAFNEAPIAGTITVSAS